MAVYAGNKAISAVYSISVVSFVSSGGSTISLVGGTGLSGGTFFTTYTIQVKSNTDPEIYCFLDNSHYRGMYSSFSLIKI